MKKVLFFGRHTFHKLNLKQILKKKTTFYWVSTRIVEKCYIFLANVHMKLQVPVNWKGSVIYKENTKWEQIIIAILTIILMASILILNNLHYAFLSMYKRLGGRLQV